MLAQHLCLPTLLSLVFRPIFIPIFCQTKLFNQAQHSGLEGSVAFLEDDHALFQELLCLVDENKLIRDALRVLSEVSQCVDLSRWLAFHTKELFLAAEL